MPPQNGVDEVPGAEIESRIREILVSDLRVAPEIIAASHSRTPLLGHGIGLDSMETLSLVAGVERAFDLEIEDEDLTADIFTDIGSFVAFLERQISRHSERGGVRR